MVTPLTLLGTDLIMSENNDTFMLPELIRMEDCDAIDAFLRSCEGKTAQLEGGNVRKCGGMAAQLILAHQGFYRAQGKDVTVTAPSAELAAALNTLGLGRILTQAGDAT